MIEGAMAYGLVWIPPGELADRISILEIKREKSYCDPNELADLHNQWDQIGLGRDYIDQLKGINLEAWDCVDQIYNFFDSDEFSVNYMEQATVCRKAHQLNKQRVTLKNQINAALGVDRKEVKTWKA